MGFSVKIAPGIRVRASSRGIRTSIGPRAARIHVGGGRSGFSTGVGPFGYYTSVGGSHRSRSRSRRPSAGSYQRQLTVSPAAAAKAEEAQRLARVFQGLLDIHREPFEPAERPLAPAPPPLDAAAVRRSHLDKALTGISWFKRAERASARARAEQSADTELEAMRVEGERQQAAFQAELDAWWSAVLRNDPSAVIGALAEAFEDNEAAAAPVGVDGDEVSIVVLGPPESIVPERMPGRTQAGNISLRKLPKGERASFYTLAVMGHVLVTIKEALAEAPSIEHVRIVAVRNSGPDAYGRPRLECLLAGRWSRARLQRVAWAEANAATVAEDTASELLINSRAGKELQPLDLSAQPEIRAVLDVLDVDELVS